MRRRRRGSKSSVALTDPLVEEEGQEEGEQQEHDAA
jgi:hypothetical protein